jgi:hypothetical protein
MAPVAGLGVLLGKLISHSRLRSASLMQLAMIFGEPIALTVPNLDRRLRDSIRLNSPPRPS